MPHQSSVSRLCLNTSLSQLLRYESEKTMSVAHDRPRQKFAAIHCTLNSDSSKLIFDFSSHDLNAFMDMDPLSKFITEWQDSML